MSMIIVGLAAITMLGMALVLSLILGWANKAFHVEDGLARVDYEKCVGCGACAKVCPRHIITMAPFKSQCMLVVECSNHDAGKDVKAVCKVGCLGCHACERASGLFTVVNNLSTINYDNYPLKNLESGLMAAKKCPVTVWCS